QKSLTHLSRRSFGGRVVARVELDHDVPADVNVAHQPEAEGVQRVGNRFSLRIEEPATRRDMDGNAIAIHSVEPVGVSEEGGGSVKSGDDEPGGRGPR